MSAVMVMCPDTGRPVSTQIETEPGELRKLSQLAGRMRCPACGKEHIWLASAAWLAGEPHLVAAAQAKPAGLS